MGEARNPLAGHGPYGIHDSHDSHGFARHDCLIAQIAIENGLTLLHNDRDFNAIASVVGQLRLYPGD
jgi:predicted nucleic acid-binding protein